ncbi:MAG: hypothetical protein ACI8RD_006906 [Bacillariaceae sp.]|jgi:hypothetical protein
MSRRALSAHRRAWEQEKVMKKEWLQFFLIVTFCVNDNKRNGKHVLRERFQTAQWLQPKSC